MIIAPRLQYPVGQKQSQETNEANRVTGVRDYR